MLWLGLKNELRYNNTVALNSRERYKHETQTNLFYTWLNVSRDVYDVRLRCKILS